VNNGMLVFQEPCAEGYILMGAMAQFLPLVLEKMEGKISARHIEQVRLFTDAMSFYARRDIDKAGAEDKHLFRVDEIMKSCASAGLEAEFFPNRAFERFYDPAMSPVGGDDFFAFFRDYLKYCMSFDEKLVELFERHFRKYCRFVEVLSEGGGGPYMHGVFLCRKRH
jgi:hypothetical protein